MVRLVGLGLAVVGLVACSATTAASGDDAIVATAESACLPRLDCAAPADPKVEERAWRHPIASTAVVLAGPPMHRGRDLFVAPDGPQTVIAKFAYDLSDIDLDDEEVDVFVQRDCGSGWEKLGTTLTTGNAAPHPTVEGVEDFGGRVYFDIPPDKKLGPGRHRIRLVVAGDLTSTELFLDVVPAGTKFFVSDVDGTLTSSENIELAAMLVGATPGTHDGAPEALRALADKGYRAMYLTARPEQLTSRTREFLGTHGFPPGIIHTSTSELGAGIGASAASYKTGEMKMLADKGLVPSYVFGNKTSDSDAYASVEPKENRFFFQIDGSYEGRRIESYTELLPAFSAVARVCRP